jgi:cystathionine beta-lyase
MSGGEDEPAPETRLAETGRRPEWTGIPGQRGGVVNPPVWRASTILYEDTEHLKAGAAGKDHQWYYGRRGTPTQWALAEALTEMEIGRAHV